MKEIKLSGKRGEGKVALVDDEDFEWLNQFSWHLSMSTSSKTNSVKYYASRVIGKTVNGKWKVKSYVMHREILGISNPKIYGDHKDGDGLNNQRSNLRIATNSQNQANRGRPINSLSRYKGVYKSKYSKSWYASCCKDGIRYRKAFKTEKEAAIGYNQKMIELFGEFAKVNIIND